VKEYTINMRKDGSAVIAKDFWNPDKSLKAMEEKPYLFEVGMKVVDIFSNVITIKEIHKYPSVENRAPQWTLNVEENRNTYVYYEIAGIFVKELSVDEVEKLLK
jgi:hypothetical protein